MIQYLNSGGAKTHKEHTNNFFPFTFSSADGRETSKKRTTLARLLRGLKTVNRRDRVNNQGTGATGTQARVSWTKKFQKFAECMKNRLNY